MRKSILILISLLLINSCKENNKTYDSQALLEQTEQNNETELIAQKILDLPKLQWIYHPEIKERLPIKILESNIIDKNVRLEKFDRKVKIISSSELKKLKIKDYIEFKYLVIKSDTAEFKLSYKIEGVGSKGKFVKNNGEWKILQYKVWEN